MALAAGATLVLLAGCHLAIPYNPVDASPPTPDRGTHPEVGGDLPHDLPLPIDAPKADMKPPKADAKPPKADTKLPKADAKLPKADTKPPIADITPPKADGGLCSKWSKWKCLSNPGCAATCDDFELSCDPSNTCYCKHKITKNKKLCTYSPSMGITNCHIYCTPAFKSGCCSGL